MRVIAMIPARYDSSRFPAKALADIAGKPMIQRVYEQVKKSSVLEDVIVVTDSEKILKTVESFGGKAMMTSKDCQSGTDRIAEAVKDVDCEIVVNVQGDEPLIVHEVIDAAIEPLLNDPNILMGTAVSRISDLEDIENHNVAKVVLDKDNFVIYFSRSAIPCSKNSQPDIYTQVYYKHIGIYVYRKDFVLTFSSLPQMPLEKIESLEQLRALEHGYKIKATIMDYDSVSVDVPEDVERVKELINKRKML
ncbi:MAG: 3-deoxy-manno-octulosonate cytidylyltransferase [bacterium]